MSCVTCTRLSKTATDSVMLQMASGRGSLVPYNICAYICASECHHFKSPDQAIPGPPLGLGIGIDSKILELKLKVTYSVAKITACGVSTSISINVSVRLCSGPSFPQTSDLVVISQRRMSTMPIIVTLEHV